MTTEQKPEETGNMEVLTYTAGGGVAGVATSALIGQMGLAVAGGVVTIGFLPMIGIGAMTGLAAYGLKRAIYN